MDPLISPLGAANATDVNDVIAQATFVFKAYMPIGFILTLVAAVLLLLPYCVKYSKAHPQGILMHLQFLQLLNSVRIFVIGWVFRAQ